MAEKIKGTSQQRLQKTTDKKAKKGKSILIFVMVFFILFIVFAASVYAGIYFKMIDLPKLADKWHLYDYPVIGQYFPKPKTNFPIVNLPPAEPANQQQKQAVQPVQPQPNNGAVTGAQGIPPAPGASAQPATAPNVDKAIVAAKQKEEERISKLASLFGAMDPEQAVPIINRLDDTTVLAIFNKMDADQVSQILAQMDPKRAAKLTQEMYNGNKP